jgi:phospholipase D1/2
VPFQTNQGSLEVLLLHGNLDIWVKEAKNLPNKDMFHKNLRDMLRKKKKLVDKFAKFPGSAGRKIEEFMSDEITSDSYVTISLYSFLFCI